MTEPSRNLGSPRIEAAQLPSSPPKEKEVGSLLLEETDLTIKEIKRTPPNPQGRVADVIKGLSERITDIQQVFAAPTSLVPSAAPSPTSATVPTPEEIEKRRRAETGLIPSIHIPGTPTEGSFTILQRMEELNVPGVSITVIDDGKIWSQGYGELEQPGILSQAASLSKVITSLTVLSMVREGKLTLNTDIRTLLGDPLLAHIDPDGLTKIKGNEITIRKLLSHTAGIPGGGSEYFSLEALGRQILQIEQEIEVLNSTEDTVAVKSAQDKLAALQDMSREAAGEPIPSTDDILEGRDRWLGPVRIKPQIMGHYEYSNPGYTILQKVIEVVEGSFSDAVQTRVLDKLDMRKSTYSPSGRPIIHGNDVEGKPIPGLYRTTPHLAAGGLWTTSEDLAKVVIGLQKAITGEDRRIIDPEQALPMVTAQSEEGYGLGMGVEQQGRSLYFAHSGAINGFSTFLIGNEKQGAIILTNSNNGDSLYPEIIKSIATAYNWPHESTLGICQPQVPPSQEPINPETWVAGKTGSYLFRENRAGKEIDHTITIRLEPQSKKILLNNGERDLELIPLGEGVAGYRLHVPGPYTLCRFREGGSRLHLFGSDHIRIN
jgi:CubicO group peptidase (beta-lactamase class C family)